MKKREIFRILSLLPLLFMLLSFDKRVSINTTVSVLSIVFGVLLVMRAWYLVGKNFETLTTQLQWISIQLFASVMFALGAGRPYEDVIIPLTLSSVFLMVSFFIRKSRNEAPEFRSGKD